MKQYQNENKSLEEINKEIEEQLQFEMENGKEEESLPKRRAVYSVTGLIMLIILGRFIYHIVQLYI